MKKQQPTWPEGWVIETETNINGRHVTPGTELSIKGVRGRFRFVKHVLTDNAEWIDVWGGPKHYEQFRAFRPEQVRTVHRIVQTGKGLLDARKNS